MAIPCGCRNVALMTRLGGSDCPWRTAGLAADLALNAQDEHLQHLCQVLNLHQVQCVIYPSDIDYRVNR
jgi:hypothetical protein